ncbi:MAG: PQQ-binding-like beta-propeller repeat protein, partial [Spirochaetota bacterium]
LGLVNIEDAKSKGGDESIQNVADKIETYTDGIYTMSASKKLNYAVAGYPDGNVWLWDINSGNYAEITKHIGIVYDVKLSSDLSYIVSAGSDGKAKFWQSSGIKEIKPGNTGLYSIALRPNSDIITLGGKKFIYFWNPDTDSVESIELGQNTIINTLEYNNKGNNLAVGLTDGSIVIVRNVNDPDNKRVVTLTNLPGVINSFKFSPDDKYLISSSQDGSIRRWDLETYSSNVITSKNQGISDFEYDTASNSYLMMASGNSVIGVNLRKTNIDNFIFMKHRAHINQIERSKSDIYALSSGDDGLLKLTDLRKRSYYHNNKFFDLTMEVVESENRDEWQKIFDKKINNYLFSDNNYLYTITGNNELTVINKNNNSTVWNKPLDDYTIYATPVLTENYIICSSTIGKLLIINKENGNIEDTIDLEERAATTSNQSYYVKDNKVYFGTQGSVIGGIFYGIDISTKEVFLKLIIEGNIAATPVGKDDKVYIVSESGTVYSTTLGNSETDWNVKPVEGLFRFTKPIIYEDKLVYGASTNVGGGKSYVIAIDRFSGETLWKTEYSGSKVWSVSDSSGFAYFIDNNGIVKININNGELIRLVNIDSSNINTNTNLTLINDELYVTGISDKILSCFDKNSGELKWDYTIKNYTAVGIPIPDESNNLIYVSLYSRSESKSKVVAIKIKVGEIVTKTLRIEEESNEGLGQ